MHFVLKWYFNRPDLHIFLYKIAKEIYIVRKFTVMIFLMQYEKEKYIFVCWLITYKLN